MDAETKVTGIKSKFNNLSKKKKIAAITGCSLLIVLMLCMCCSTVFLAVSSANLGKRNSLSYLSQTVATENMPIIKLFGKSNEQIVQDAFAVNFATDQNSYAESYSGKKDFNGNIIANSKLSGDFNISTNSGDFKSNFSLSNKLNTNLKDKMLKQSSSLTGKVSYGVVSVDLEENPISIDTITSTEKNNKDTYVRLGMTDNMFNMIFNQSGGSYESFQKSTGINIKDYVNNYVKINSDSLQKTLGTSTLSTTNKQIDQAELNSFLKDLGESYNTTVNKYFTEYAKVEYKGREDVNGIQTIKYKITIDKDKFQDRLFNYFDTIPEIVVKHKALFYDKTTCDASEKQRNLYKSYGSSYVTPATAGFCSDEELGLIKSGYNDQKSQLRDSFSKVFKSVDFENFNVNIIPSVDMINKFEFTMKLNDYGKEQIQTSAGSSTKLNIKTASITVESDIEIKLNAEKIEVPSNPKNFDDLVKQYNDYQKNLYNKSYDYSSSYSGTKMNS